MALAQTLMFVWTPNGRLPLAGSTSLSMYTDVIDTEGSDQIGIFVYTTPAASAGSGGTDTNIYIRIAWAGTLPGEDQPTLFIEEYVESPGSVVTVGGVQAQRYSLTIKEYGPITTGPTPSHAAIWIAAAAHYFKIGCYGDATPSGNAAVTMFVERTAVSSQFQQGR